MKSIFDNFSQKDFFKPLKKKQTISSIIKNHTTIDVGGDQISFSDDTVFISIRPLHKMYILEKEKELLEDFSLHKETAYIKKII